MASEINVERATVNILVELNGNVYLVAMEKDNFDAVSFIAKRSIESLVETGRTQLELLDFLNYKDGESDAAMD